MKRRYFLTLGCITSSGLLLPSIGFYSCSNNISDVYYPIDSLDKIFNEEKILDIGKIYLDINHEENEIEVLKKLILDLEMVEANDEITSKILIQEKVKKDFKIGNTMLINGWILSQTEVRQCALFSLIKN